MRSTDYNNKALKEILYLSKLFYSQEGIEIFLSSTSTCIMCFLVEDSIIRRLKIEIKTDYKLQEVPPHWPPTLSNKNNSQIIHKKGSLS